MTFRGRNWSAKASQGMIAGWFTLALTGCGKPMADLNRLAAEGSIDDAAPVMAHVQVEVQAPAERVWAVLVDLPSWPRWHQGIESVSGPSLSLGSSVVWTTGGTKIHAEVRSFQPPYRLSWTGKAYTAKAVHLWTLTALAPDRTKVAIDESMEGPWMEKFFSSQQLQDADLKWVTALKRQVERK